MGEGEQAEWVYVEAPARLHLGILALQGVVARSFGGIGTAAPMSPLLVSATRAPTVEAEGPDAERAAVAASRVLRYHGASGGARLRVHHTVTSGAGLGSGTMLALAAARAVAELYGLPATAPELARAAGCARHAAASTWVFDEGGIVVDAGWRTGSEDCGPLLARMPVPSDWRCVVAVPEADPRSATSAERWRALGARPAPPAHEAERASHLVLSALLPAIREEELTTFGAALAALHALTAPWLAAAHDGAGGKTARATRCWRRCAHGAHRRAGAVRGARRSTRSWRASTPASRWPRTCAAR